MRCSPRSTVAPFAKRRSSVIAAAGLVCSTLVATAPSARADTAYAFGLNQFGQVSNGLTGGSSGTDNAPTSLSVMMGFDGLVSSASGGGGHSLVVDNGALYAVGFGTYGQLGIGPSPAQSNPLPIATQVLTSGVTAVQGGLYYSMALSNGGVYFFGFNSDGQAGNGSSGTVAYIPALVPGLTSGVTAIAAGQRHEMAIKNGALYTWAYNSAGQIGNGTTIPANPLNITTVYAVPNMSSGVTSIAGGTQHTLAVKNGAVYAWGFNNFGQLGGDPGTEISGNTAAAAYTSPQPVVGLPSGIPVSKVSAGGTTSMALVQGSIYAWGQNEYGELGNGTTSPASAVSQTPTLVPGITGFVTDVEEGSYSSYALTADGTLWSWGRNTYGQLGIGSNDNTNTPTQVLPPTGKIFTAIDTTSSAQHVIVTVTNAPSSWIPDSSGNWNDSTNWTAGVPNSADAGVYLTTPPITASRIITTTTPVTIGNLNFNSALSYIIQGTGSITVQATPYASALSGAINDYVGNHTVAPAKLEFASNSTLNVTYGLTLTLGSPTGSIVVDSNTSLTETGYGSVAFNSAVSLQSGASLSLTTPTSINGLTLASNATTTVAPHGFFADNLLTLGSLSLNPSSTLDLANNQAIVHNGNLTAISAALGAGYKGGAWNGSGIISSTAASDTTHLTTLGSLMAASAMNVSGQSLAAGDVLIKYTYYGDADLSGSVDGSDYSRIDNGFLSHLTGWNNGDFNYDGTVNGSDYTLIDNAFNTQGAQLSTEVAASTAQSATGTSAVPEPVSLALLGIGVVGLLGRHRRFR